MFNPWLCFHSKDQTEMDPADMEDVEEVEEEETGEDNSKGMTFDYFMHFFPLISCVNKRLTCSWFCWY